jgi:hypothetical protein
VEYRTEATLGNYFRARLLKDRAAYISAGGVANSSGIYSSRTETFLVPFREHWCEDIGQEFLKERGLRFQHDGA